MFRQAASRASALVRQSAAGGQRRQMAEVVAADKLHFNFFLPGGTIQKDAAVVCFMAMPGRRVFGGWLARLDGGGPGECGDGGMLRFEGTGGATGVCWVGRLVSVVCDAAQVQTARRAQWGSLGHVVASGSGQAVRERCVSLAVDRPRRILSSRCDCLVSVF